MKINPVIQKKLSENRNIITTHQVVELGFSRQILSTYTRNNLLMRVRQGMYMPPYEIHDDMYTLFLKYPNIVFSHESALCLQGISERVPEVFYITFPSQTLVSASLRHECRIFYTKPELVNIGLISIKTFFGNKVRCYNKERALCDMLKDRKVLDIDSVLCSLRNYMDDNNSDLTKLHKYAQKFNVENILNTYLHSAL